MSEQRKPAMRGPMGGHGMGRGEKAKDFKGTLRQLIRYIGQYKIGIIEIGRAHV